MEQVRQHKPVFVWPRGLEEWMLVATFVVWPFIFVFVIHPDNADAFAQVVLWVSAFVAEVGILVALRNVREKRGIA